MKPAFTRDSLCMVKLARQPSRIWSQNVCSITTVGRSKRGATCRAVANIASITTRSGLVVATSSTSSSPTAGELVYPNTVGRGRKS